MKQAIAIGLLLALGCGSADETKLAEPQATAEEEPRAPLGVGEVNGLPGTPLEWSGNGLPIIEGVERPDYADDGINSFDKRLARRTEQNPTGEYRFNLDELGPQELIADADDRAGFRNGMEEYTWRLTHKDVLHSKATFSSYVFHGKAFTTNSDGSLNALGACWLNENAGKDCEFPSKKKFSVKDYFAIHIDGLPPCNNRPPVGVFAIDAGNQPSVYIQAGADMWKPEATLVQDGGDQISVFCDDLPGSHFGGVLGSSGGFGGTRRRVTNAKDAYPRCANAVASFPRGLFTYDLGEVRYDPINLYDRGLLCGADKNSPDMLKIASTNMFAHEFGHVLGFAHFSTGIMATGTDCGVFYSQLRTIPSAFHKALRDFTPNSGTFKFADIATCNAPPVLPTPLPNNQQFPFGRLQE